MLRYRVCSLGKQFNPLKAVMCLHHLEYRRTHDLEELAARLTTAGVLLPVTEEQLSHLTPYAVEFRYDDGAFHLLVLNSVQFQGGKTISVFQTRRGVFHRCDLMIEVQR